MKHKENLVSAIALNKKSGIQYDIVLDKYSKCYKVIDGPSYLVGIRTYSKRLTSHTVILKIFKKAPK